MDTYDKLVNKWSVLLDDPEIGAIKDPYRRKITAALLENEEKAIAEESSQQSYNANLNEAAPTNNYGSGNIASYDPILINLVRRTTPNLIAFDFVGVQPMNGPTGLVFALKSRYNTQTGDEALFNEADTGFTASSWDSVSSPEAANAYGEDIAGNGVASGNAGPTSGLPSLEDDTSPYVSDDTDSPQTGIKDTVGARGGMTTAQAEALGDARDNDFREMAFSIEKATVTARSRALKAEYTMELQQDLKAIHGLDAESELSAILQTEVQAEMNREIVRTMNLKAKLGCQHPELTYKAGGSQLGGVFDLRSDSDGRWAAEHWRGLLFHIEREAGVIARETRRGRGNILICSSDVAAGFAALGSLEYNPEARTSLTVDDTGNTYVGMLNGRIKVYIDPYATDYYINLGYKGSNAYDAGLFYCPYVPLVKVRAVGEQTFQPKIGFKTRYGIVANPMAESSAVDNAGNNRSNPYYRIFKVTNLTGSNH